MNRSAMPGSDRWNATILFANMGYGQDCNQVNDLVDALDPVISEVNDLQLPNVRVVIVSFGTNSTDVAGNPDLAFYRPDESDLDPIRVMISLDSAWRSVSYAWDDWEEVAVVRVTEDRGPWNKYYDERDSLRIARYTLLSIFCVMATYALIQIIYLVTYFRLLYSIQPNTIYRQNQKHFLQPISYELNIMCIDLIVIMWSRFARKMSSQVCINIISVVAICHLVLITVINILWVATNVASRKGLFGAFFITVGYIFPSLNFVLIVGIVITIAFILSQVKDIHLPAETIKTIISNPLILTPTLDYFRVLFQYITMLAAYFGTIFFLRIKPRGVIRQIIASRAGYLNQRSRSIYWRYHGAFARFSILPKRQVAPDTPATKTTTDAASQSNQSSTP
ncbi:hypothetical protein H4R35_000900 [Dimargaris xerosporica]|nr:hypothetical protein H4R35_000900 [Dimargaris xerosporica]